MVPLKAGATAAGKADKIMNLLLQRQTSPPSKSQRVNSVEHRRLLEQDGWEDELNLSVSDVITIVKKFLKEDAGFEDIRITSAVAIEGEAEWKVTADIGQPARDKKEIVVNDRDGKVISYKTA